MARGPRQSSVLRSLDCARVPERGPAARRFSDSQSQRRLHKPKQESESAETHVDTSVGRATKQAQTMTGTGPSALPVGTSWESVPSPIAGACTAWRSSDVDTLARALLCSSSRRTDERNGDEVITPAHGPAQLPCHVCDRPPPSAGPAAGRKQVEAPRADFDPQFANRRYDPGSADRRRPTQWMLITV